MGRKNLFQTDVATPETAARPAPARREMPEAIGRGPVGIMGNDLLSNSIREIDPDRIEASGLADRLEIEDEGIAELRESIRAHGQQVPIMVRPIRERPGHFRIVYGRRRVAALRGLGIKAKAIIRTLDETEALVAQGQENNLRRNPSYIEKASFAAMMRDAGYSNEVVMAALGVEKTALSKMKSVTDVVPYALIERIGSAPESGRRKWTDLADLARSLETPDLSDLLKGVDLSRAAKSDHRLALLTAHLRARRAGEVAVSQSAPPARTKAREERLVLSDGQKLAELRRDTMAVTLKISRREQPEFGAWLEDRAEDILRRLHAEWTGTQDRS
ncbi:plasmid partitioning protein RepB (plasmid) [Limimaricola variabilis]|uniref:plasmid partitioning protein RepB n=1 Tax=Limimaricola variabilis TaxID=1492771 RepID=UPI002AC8E0B7|nr:plasmid partitioning protein RepB [Limimaricola variabilis]WPY97003.1 plasmid partitioning protein RepB [Limimaricola variabilis]